VEDASDVHSVWQQTESTPADPSLPINSTSVNRTIASNLTHSLPRYEAAVVYGMNEILLTNLNHYQEYNIEVSVLFLLKVPVKHQPTNQPAS